MIGNFVVGEKYTRDQVYFYYNQIPRPQKDGSTWNSGYTRSFQGYEENGYFFDDLIFFINVGVPGKTGHDFHNTFNPDCKQCIMADPIPPNIKS